MQKKTIRAVSMILAALMAAPMLFACGKKPVDSAAATDDPADTTPKVEELEVPDTKYDGAEFHILTAGHVAYMDFGFTAEDETILGQAQYKREQTVNQSYDVVIKVTQAEEKKSTNGAGPGWRNINKAVSSSSVDYHLGIIGGYDVSNLAEANNLYDLNSLKHIDTSKSWWDQNANNDLTINGMLFYTNGSLTAAYSESTFVIYVNKTLATAELGADVDLYQMVKDGKWTIDKLAEYSRTISEDLNGDDKMDGNDKYGLYVWDDSMLGMMGAAGTKSATVQEDGTIALTLYNDNTINMFNKFIDIATDTAYACQYQRAALKPAEGAIAAFQNGKALFWQTSNTNTKNLRDMEADFGVLPYPKLSEDQDRYYSTIAPYNSQFICVPLYLDGQEEYVGHITEALAYHGQKITWPACYEQTLKGSFARDEGTYDMLDIIYNNYGYDIGYYYQVGGFTSVLMNLLRQSDRGFASKYEASAPAAEAELKAINDNYKIVLEWWTQD